MKKKKMKLKNIIAGLFGFALAILVGSCGSKKDVVYFQDIGNYETIVSDNTFEPVFKVDDVISIYISTLNPEASVPFNLTIGVAGSEGAQSLNVDYLVDKNGEIDFPVIGKIKVVGLSPEQLRIRLREELSDYLKDPIINIRLRNFTVTLLGQVMRPGTYPINGEKITILEALGLAGDMTIKGVRNNVLVIREFEGTKIYHRIDLTSKELINSPAFYLTQNDVVYVEPNNSAVASSTLDSRTTIAISLISLLITSTLILTR
ncbi:polysaccharide biosynthesis/export family protein [Robiginitalea sp. IMCC44478]|uniref:polysaccharide biosynthesis/export family protein n=1 Tax=Robiginitalea sp. IMCC44478 TaxID=3459122 RepID=UPI004043764C